MNVIFKVELLGIWGKSERTDFDFKGTFKLVFS